MFSLLLTVAFTGLAACLQPDIIAGITKTPIDAKGQLWAVLVSGSNYWFNYRHQADVCHAYQILHSHGIPDERIVVMMYDDIAYNKANPTPGIIINHPNGEDVYHDVPHDYTGKDVTPDNFLNVLQGNEEKMKHIGSGKVVKSGPNDHVFFYFADHGAPGIVLFPEQYLGARELMGALRKMHREKKFKKMVIYVEACESGSMFNKLLPKNMSIFATTAASPEESSYACYLDPKLHTYLGDLYSVNWMEDSDMENITRETLQKQYRIVKRETNKSHVQEYGDLSIADMHVSEFQGRKESRPIRYKPFPRDAVPSREVPLEILKRKLMAAVGEEKYKVGRMLKKLLRNRAFADQILENIVGRVARSDRDAYNSLTKKQEINDFDCYEEVVRHFHDECFHLSKNEYVLGKLYILVNLCENNLPVNVIKDAMEEVCIHPSVYGII